MIPPIEHFHVMEMVKDNEIDLVIDLVQQNTNLAKYVWTNKQTTLLHVAARMGQISLVRTITQIPNVNVHVKDALGQDALFHACKHKQREIVSYLLEHTDADATTRCIEWTALGIASAHGCKDICRMLMEHGAKLFATMIGDRDINCDTPYQEKSALWWYRQYCAVDTDRDGVDELVEIYMGIEELNDVYENDAEKQKLVTKHDAEIARITRQSEKDKSPLCALLFSDTCSDVEIETASGLKIPAHKCILAAKSDIFRTMFCSTSWLENCRSSDGKGRLSLATFSESAVRTMLSFMYVSVVHVDELVLDMEGVLELASQYMLNDLKAICDQQMHNYCERNDSSPDVLVHIFSMADHYNLIGFDQYKVWILTRPDVLASKSLSDLRDRRPELWAQLGLTKRMRYSEIPVQA